MTSVDQASATTPLDGLDVDGQAMAGEPVSHVGEVAMQQVVGIGVRHELHRLAACLLVIKPPRRREPPYPNPTRRCDGRPAPERAHSTLAAMAMIFPSCGQENPDGVRVCGMCGFRVELERHSGTVEQFIGDAVMALNV